MIKDLKWSKIISIQDFKERENDPTAFNEGIMVLMDSDENIIFVSASNDFYRRKCELFEKENTDGRFNCVRYIQLAHIDSSDKRFTERREIKELLTLVSISAEGFENVLDDNDPRITEIYREFQEMRDQEIKKHSQSFL